VTAHTPLISRKSLSGLLQGGEIFLDSFNLFTFCQHIVIWFRSYSLKRLCLWACAADQLVNPVLRSIEQNSCLSCWVPRVQGVLQSSIVLSLLDNVIAVYKLTTESDIYVCIVHVQLPWLYRQQTVFTRFVSQLFTNCCTYDLLCWGFSSMM